MQGYASFSGYGVFQVKLRRVLEKCYSKPMRDLVHYAYGEMIRCVPKKSDENKVEIGAS